MKQAKGQRDAAVISINAKTESGISTGAFNSNSPFSQVLEAAEESEISGSAVTFPPGALAISTSISIQEGAPVATPALAGALSIPSGFQTVATPVSVTSADALDAAKPFTIAIPLPPSTSGLSLADLYDNLLVAYVVKIAATGETRIGVLPRSMLVIGGKKVSFESHYFGVFQAALSAEKIREEIKAETTVLSAQTKADQNSLPPLEVTSRTPFIVREGQSVTLRGKNIRPTIRLALGGKSISSLSLASDASLSFVAPPDVGTGLLTLNVEQEGTKQDVSLIFEKNGPYPVISADKTKVCNDIQFYDLDGVLQTGERDCRTTIPDCSSDGEIGCKTTASLKAAHMSNVTPGNIKAGVVIGGVSGNYPSSLYPLSGSSGTADLDMATFDAKIKSSANFEWFDAAGNPYTRSGESNITPGLILNGVSIFGTVGSYVPGSMSVASLTATKGTSKVALSWTRTGGTGVIIVRRAGASVAFTPTHGVSYAQGYTSGSDEVVFRGSAATVDDTNVVAGTTYYYQTFAYNADNAYSGASNETSVLYTDVEICGGAGDSCYDDSAAIAAGTATTPLGKNLEYVTASGSFKVWKEVGGNRILRANGLDEWARKLNLNGKGLAVSEFTDWVSLEGRKCPPNVYIDDADKFATGHCLFYTDEAAAEPLNFAGTTQTNASSIGLNAWSNYNGGAARWYVGNIKTCSDKGMRLPTVFETATTTTSNANFPTDGVPTFAGSSTGIPPHANGAIWTASASTALNSDYWTWNNGPTVAGFPYSTSNYVRCVLP